MTFGPCGEDYAGISSTIRMMLGLSLLLVSVSTLPTGQKQPSPGCNVSGFLPSISLRCNRLH